MRKRAVVCHCWGGHPDFIWYPYAKVNLETLGFQVEIPALPDTDNPCLDQWLPALKSAVGKPNEDTILVGHSLGCATILRYLESLGGDQKVGGVVLVAGFTDERGDAEIRSFFEGPFDYQRIKPRSRGFISIHSDNDRALEPDYFKHAKIFLKQLRAKLIIIPDGGHFTEADNCTELPEVVSSVKELAEI